MTNNVDEDGYYIEQVQRAAHTEPGKCAAVTRKSQRCKVPADEDSEFCHLHRPDGKYQQQMQERWEEKGRPKKKEPWF